MRFNKLDMNLLVALDALLQEGSITRAADKLNLSVSATSSALGRLRDYFEDELLVQVGRKMELTPRAESLKEPIRDILVRVDLTVSAVPGFEPAESKRKFRIFASDYTQAVLGPHLFALAEAQSSKASVNFLQQAAESIRELERGEADMLIIPTGIGSQEHPEEPLFKDEFCCVVWDQGPWAADGPLTLDQYLSAGHVVMQPAGAATPSLEGIWAQRLGAQRHVAATTSSFTAIPQMIVGTRLIATMHRRLAIQAARGLPLRLKPSPLPIPPMQQVMQWHKYRTQDPGLIWLRSLLKAATERMLAQGG